MFIIGDSHILGIEMSLSPLRSNKHPCRGECIQRAMHAWGTNGKRSIVSTVLI